MVTKVITTFSIDGYELYGKKMVNAWLEHWPSNFELIVYTEDFNLEEKNPRLKEIDLNDACPTLKEFKEKSKLLYDDNKKTKRRIDKAIRWSHKVYAISHALAHSNDYLIFLDGDTCTRKSVPPDFASSLVKNHLFAVHFEKLIHGLHFETGLIVFNLNHPQIHILKEELQKGYDNFKIYNLPKAWDSFWFVHLYKTFNLDVLNLGYGVFTNPLVKERIIHNVGKEKFNNSSIKYDKYSGRKL
jgi:hypothetical protein